MWPFNKLFNWTKSFFVSVAKTVAGQAAESISETAKEVVNKMEEKQDLSGPEKFKQAKDILTKKYPSMDAVAIDLAIQAAVAIVDDYIEE